MLHPMEMWGVISRDMVMEDTLVDQHFLPLK